MAFEPTFTHQNPGRDTWFLIYGPPKHGKTLAAASFSEFYPEKLPAGQMTLLRDMYWLQFDKDGTLTLDQMGLSVPYTDLSSCKDYREYGTLRDRAIKEIKEGVEAGVTKAIVVDTISSLDTLLQYEAGRIYSDEKYSAKMWGKVKEFHTAFCRALMPIKVPIIFLCHARAESVMASAMKEAPEVTMGRTAKRQATVLDDNAKISIQISGQSKEFYKNQCSTIWPLRMTRSGPVIYPKGTGMFEGGTRLQGLALQEPAHLRHILQKAQAAKPKLEE